MHKWIVSDAGHLGGSLRVRDTRISLSLILESLAAGLSVAEIVDAYPSLTEESVRGALTDLAPGSLPSSESFLEKTFLRTTFVT